jgi:hypothetical protein
MNSRRSFFKRIAAAVAVVALAPQLAFRQKLALPVVEVPAINMQELFDTLYGVQRNRMFMGNPETIDIFTDADTAKQITGSLARYQWKQKHREERLNART